MVLWRCFLSHHYKQGLNRHQQQLLPPSLDDYVDEDNAVRAIDSYVEILDLSRLQVKNLSKKSNDGQPAFHPKLLLKIYIYGYLNKIRSSRSLEKEIKRNIEMIWLTQGLTPSYKTIANFRKENPIALKEVFKEFVLLCREVGLIEGKLVAIDGAFLRANASKNQLIMKKNLLKDLEQIDEKITNYLTMLDTTDKEEKNTSSTLSIPKKIAKLHEKKEQYKSDLALLEKLAKTQYNRTDPDASLMVKPAHNLMAYNTQIAVDSKYKFIIASEVSSNNNDVSQLYTMAKLSKEIVSVEKLTVVVDTGYESAIEIKKCIDEEITPIIPKANKQKAQEDKGVFVREKFIYHEQSDSYRCPNNQEIKRTNSTQIKREKLLFNYRSSSAVCKNCPLRDKCLPQQTPYKQLFRWEHEEVIEKHNRHMQTDEAKTIIKQRGSIVEHPFGTIKRTLGWDHFLVRGIEKVSGENSLIMFSYNFRRVINLIGTALFRKLLIALRNGNIKTIKEEIAAYISRYLDISGYFFQILIIFGFMKKNAKYILR